MPITFILVRVRYKNGGKLTASARSGIGNDNTEEYSGLYLSVSGLKVRMRRADGIWYKFMTIHFFALIGNKKSAGF